MLPDWELPAASPVLMVTLVPALRAVLIVPALIVELEFADVKVWGFPLTSVPVPPMSIVISKGSSNQVPARPAGAEASAAWLTASSRLPEVSMKPPSPPSAPPRALKFPCTLAVSSAQTTTVPPWPWAVASARSSAPLSI